MNPWRRSALQLFVLGAVSAPLSPLLFDPDPLQMYDSATAPAKAASLHMNVL